MLLLWWLRTVIHLKKTDLEHLQQYKHSVFPALEYKETRLGSEWEWNSEYLQNKTGDFFTYVGYCPRTPNSAESDPQEVTAGK